MDREKIYIITRAERKVVLHHFSPTSRTIAFVAKFVLGKTAARSSVDGGAPRGMEGGGEGGREGGYVRRRGSKGFIFLIFIILRAIFPAQTASTVKGVCHLARQVTENEEGEVLKLSKRQGK